MKVLIGMSGGIDSTYAAHLLRYAGHDVEGAVLVMSGHTNIEAAEISARQVGIKLNVINCEKKFDEFVINNLIDEYSAGKTPNPCVMCNRYVKIAALCDSGFDKIATGHYAHVKKAERYYIERAKDSSKDQSYVLWQLTQEQLSKLITPLAGLGKKIIKADAAKLGYQCLPESQEICFIPDKDYAGYIERIRGKYPSGNFIDTAGNVLGTHSGIINYTIGQRKGLGVSIGKPMFVTKIDAIGNTVTLAEEEHLFTTQMEVGGLVYQYLNPEKTDFQAEVKIRYAAKPVSAHVKIKNDRALVTFQTPVRAVTPGQSAVFYDDNKILCGGIIN
ncbi:MAG: tRNA 2-thiouridine(34) synthase MnmA [Oscillospiraceae bacterium]|nr:tRNA 2-thiouridine(34) synthase MnmA [Oscillospiraceae bacterium]